jgi:asparagine synthetase B (glutamine-hydrolysing)
MIDLILKDIVEREVPENEVAVLLSGGMDSISVALTAHRLGKKVTAYTFHLEGQPSYDSEMAQKVSDTFGWECITVEVPKGDLVAAYKRLTLKFGCRKKTHYECIYPFEFVFPHIKENKVLTGWGADGWYGLSKKAFVNPKYLSRKSKEGFDRFRTDYFNEESVAGHAQLTLLAEFNNLELVMPYIDHEAVKDFFMSKTWDELNNGRRVAGSRQKSVVRECFQEELEQVGKINAHTNLQLGSGINVLFETLLENTEINFKDRKRMMDVAFDWRPKSDFCLSQDSIQKCSVL